MHYIQDKTIFAIVCCPHRSAIHLQRISGTLAFSKLEPYLRSTKTKEFLTRNHWQANSTRAKTSRVTLVDETDAILDDVIVTAFKAPYSFTGEDCVEIYSHGNPIILANIQSFFRKIGFVDAEAGEFSKRAFLNGKMDLIGVEAINEIITSPTRGGIELARKACEGELSQYTSRVRRIMIDVLAFLEAHIDFDEFEVGTYSLDRVVVQLNEIQSLLKELSKTFEQTKVQREGARVVFLGAPNVGKSTLFNTLLRRDRAIVTDIPGTTRDTLEEYFKIKNQDFLLLDTAGIRESTDIVEKIGIERSLDATKIADIICYLIDFSQRPQEKGEMDFLEENLHSLSHLLHKLNKNKKQCIIVFSKADLHNTIPHLNLNEKIA